MNEQIDNTPQKKAFPNCLIPFQKKGVLHTRNEHGKDVNVGIVEGTPVAAVAATGTTAMSGTNNDWDIAAKTKGYAGNSISLRVVIDAGATSPVVTVSGTAITITAASSVTAAQCKTALEAHEVANSLVALTNKSGNDGTGTVATQTAVTLTGGVDGTASEKNATMYDGTNVYVATKETTKSDTSGWRKIAHSAL